jgi:hypothetical protein
MNFHHPPPKLRKGDEPHSSALFEETKWAYAKKIQRRKVPAMDR